MGNCCSFKKYDTTAAGVATYRQMESLNPDPKSRLFFDPQAYKFAPQSWLLKSGGYDQIYKLSNEKYSGLWESMICRQIFCDQQIQESISNGATQIVILGAGYDNRFQRLKCIRDNPGLSLIEVDQPEVQLLKKNGLKDMGVIETINYSHYEDYVETCMFVNVEQDDNMVEMGQNGTVNLKDMKKSNDQVVQFCPCNFETMDFKAQLNKAKFDPNKKTVFLLEGLTQYVDKNSLSQTINIIDEICQIQGSKIIITQCDSKLITNPSEVQDPADSLKLLNQVKSYSEPWVTFFDVDESNNTFEMESQLSKNTNGNQSIQYTDQSWNTFSKTELEPRGRITSDIKKFSVERHAQIVRK